MRGRVAVVTGATRGLGLRIATRLAEAECAVAFCARDEHQVKEAGLHLAGYGLPVLARRVDVSDAGAVGRFIEEVEARFGRIDILVNNAGIIQAGPLEEMTLDDFCHAMEIDFSGTVYPTMAALPGMRRRGHGTIVNVTSIGGEISVERAMFSVGQWPLVAVNADRAARRIVKAIRRGEARVTIGLLAKLAREAHALAPGLLSRLFAQMKRLMPPPAERPTMAVRGTTLDIR